MNMKAGPVGHINHTTRGGSTYVPLSKRCAHGIGVGVSRPLLHEGSFGYITTNFLFFGSSRDSPSRDGVGGATDEHQAASYSLGTAQGSTESLASSECAG